MALEIVFVENQQHRRDNAKIYPMHILINPSWL